MSIPSPTINHKLDYLQQSVFQRQRLPELITLSCLKKDSSPLREWRKSLPDSLKPLSKVKKSQSQEFRQLLFESNYFAEKKEDAIASAIANYNQEISSSLMVANTSLDKKIDFLSSQLQEGQTESVEFLRHGFTVLAAQNIELQDRINRLEETLNRITEELTSIRQFLEEDRRKQEEREQKKKRKRLAKRDPVTKEIYDFLISETEKLSYTNSYRGARLRLALALLLVTGVRISELLPLRMKQVETLFEKKWIAIDRSKREPTNHKGFLTKEGKKIIQEFQDL